MKKKKKEDKSDAIDTIEQRKADPPFSWSLLTGKSSVSAHTELIYPSAAESGARSMASEKLLRACIDAWYHVRVAEVLAEGGAPHARDKDGQTPLHHASFNGDAKVCVLLLDAGADSNAVNDFSFTPLHYAASQGNEGVIKLLVERGAQLNPRAENGATPLRLARLRGQRIAEDVLISLGAREANL